MRAQLITGGVAAVGFLIVVIGAAMLASQFRFRQRAGTAQGTITALRAVATGGSELGTGLVYRPTVRFTTAAGEDIEVESRTGTNPAAGQVGNVVTVRYDPADPRRFSITSTARAMGCVAWALILLGGLIFVVAALILAAIAKLRGEASRACFRIAVARLGGDIYSRRREPAHGADVADVGGGVRPARAARPLAVSSPAADEPVGAGRNRPAALRPDLEPAA